MKINKGVNPPAKTDAGRHSRKQDMVRKQAPEVNRLTDLVDRIGAGRHVGLQPILEIAHHLIPCRYVVLQGFDPQHRQIHLRLGCRLPDHYDCKGPLAGRIGYETLHGGQTSAVCHDLQAGEYAATDPEVSRYRLSSYAGAAVCVEGKVIGCLSVFDDRPRRYDAGHCKILEMMAQVVALIEEHHLVAARLNKKISELDESQALNNQMLQLSPTAIYHLDFKKNRFIGFNDYMCQYTGYSGTELLNMNPEDLLTPESVQAYRVRMGDFLSGRQVPDNVEYQIRTKEGNLEWARIHTRFIYKDGRITSSIVVAHNITEQKKVLEELSEYRKKLEGLVEERTQALMNTNQKLQAEIAIRTRTALQLKAKSERLKELNTAMGVLLDKRNEDRLIAQEHIRVNLRQLVEPYLERMAASGLNSTQKQLLELIRMNLSEVVESPLAEVSEKYYIFSPGELQVANLIRNGKTTKEIARLLLLSSRTVESYRNSIRKKLGLQNRRVNLRTYLSAKD